jgi:phosphate starvation-inducible protein PhoH and related proteins
MNDTAEDHAHNSDDALQFDDIGIVKMLCGEHDRNLKTIARELGVPVRVRGNRIMIEGGSENARAARALLQDLYFLIESGLRLQHSDVVHALKIIAHNEAVHLKDVFLDTVVLSSRGRTITPKSLAQKLYVDAIRSHDIVFGIGPAGTGKTYLAMAMAVAAFLQKKVDRIILTRPAVEAGEKLGFLPGDLAEKINPYLRPLYDALHDIMEISKVSEMLQQGIIEVAPLAFMRGRTLNDSFVILDEAQNTTPEQMKMFLTRIGFHSQAIITGDITQADLPAGALSGLVQARTLLARVRGIQFCYFSSRDVVRHPLVEQIIKAYEAAAHGDTGV